MKNKQEKKKKANILQRTAIILVKCRNIFLSKIENVPRHSWLIFHKVIDKRTLIKKETNED